MKDNLNLIYIEGKFTINYLVKVVFMEPLPDRDLVYEEIFPGQSIAQIITVLPFFNDS